MTIDLTAPPDFPATLIPLFARSAPDIPLVPKKPFDATLTSEIKKAASSEEWDDALTASIHLLNDDTIKAHDIVTDREDDMACNLIHAVLHRREADFWNSKYWWSQINHPLLLELYSSSSTSQARSSAKKFVDDVQSLAGGKGGASSPCGAKNLLQYIKKQQEVELKGLVRWLWDNRESRS